MYDYNNFFLDFTKMCNFWTFLQMLLKQHIDFHSSSDYHEIQPRIHYVQTLPSVLQEMPWIQHEKPKVYFQA